MKKKVDIMEFADIWKDIPDKESDMKKTVRKIRKESTKELMRGLKNNLS